MNKIDSRRPDDPPKGKREVIEWNGVKMFKSHAIRSFARGLAKLASEKDIVQINVIGESKSGKSEFCYTLAHLMHQMLSKDYKCQYDVRYMDKQHLLNVREVFGNLGAPTIVVVDNITRFKSTSSRKFERFMSDFTEIRKYTQRIVLMLNYDFGTAVRPLLRSSADARIYLSLSDKERQSLLRIVSAKYKRKLEWFSYMSRTVSKKGKWVMKQGRLKVEYKWRDPFALAILVKYSQPRFIVFPLRTWIDPQCSVCDSEYAKLAKQ